MKNILIILCSLSLCFGAAPQKKSGSGGGNPTTLLTRLRDDTKRAMGNIEMQDKDRKKLTKAIEKLDKNLDARAQGKALNAGDIRKALDEIGSVSKSFKEDDKNTVYEDMRNIRDQRLDQDKKTAQKRLPSQKRDTLGMPRYPASRNPRRY